jgi:transposase
LAQKRYWSCGSPKLHPGANGADSVGVGVFCDHRWAQTRRYKRRWKIERTNAWFGQFRCLLVRHDHLLTIYLAFFHLACLWITLRKYFSNTL